MRVKIYGHSHRQKGFDHCPGANRWVEARIETRNAREARPSMTPLLKPMALCPKCNRWFNFDKEEKQGRMT